MAVSGTMLLNAFLGMVKEKKMLLCELIIHVTVSSQWFPFLLKGEVPLTNMLLFSVTHKRRQGGCSGMNINHWHCMKRYTVAQTESMNFKFLILKISRP